MAFPFFFFSNSYDQTCDESCIVFASLYGKPRVARNGNKEETNFHVWKIPGAKAFRTNFFPFLEIAYNLYVEFRQIFPRTEIYAFIISVSGNTRFTVQTGKNDARPVHDCTSYIL